MSRLVRRQLIVGAAAGLVSGALSLTLSTLLIGVSILSFSGGSQQIGAATALHLLLSILLGLLYARWFTRTELGFVEHALSGMAFGLFAWIVVLLVLQPALMGEGARWQSAAAAAYFPLLITYLLQGALLGLLHQVLHGLFIRWRGQIDEPTAPAEDTPIRSRVVIIGGGFAGVTTAQYLERLFKDDASVLITLVSQTNHMLFTPMLSEVTAGGVEAQHMSPALRTFFRKVRVIRGEPREIDFENHIVHLATRSSVAQELLFDHLVLAVGMVPNFFDNANIERYAFTFKSLSDAMTIRKHIIETLEAADVEPDAERRRAMLRFIVVGGGFAGVELIGGLNDFIRGSLWYFPNIDPEEVDVVLIHTRERILPELSEELALYAQQNMTARGVRFLLNQRVTDAQPEAVIMGENRLPTHTLIWTAGNKPNPLLDTLPLQRDKRGGVVTDETLAVAGLANVWALGDNAAVPDLVTGTTAPPTAQHAIREAKTLAYNIHAVTHGKPTKVFRFKSLGSLAVVGHQTAVAEVMGFKFAGLLAWLMWRGIYLSKLPTLEKKTRVLIDWVVDLFFPRDIVYFDLNTLPDLRAEAALAEPLEERMQA
jgi:NADH dehydrogenase